MFAKKLAPYRLYVYSDCRTENPETKVVRREGGVHRVITVISAGTIAFSLSVGGDWRGVLGMQCSTLNEELSEQCEQFDF